MVDIDKCISQPCVNGGTCINEENSYRCNCVSGYEGLNCEQGSHNLRNLNVIVCSCLELWLQSRCTIADILLILVFLKEVKECLSAPCQNGATCVDEINGYVCHCASGYTGTYCQTGKCFDLAFVVNTAVLG